MGAQRLVIASLGLSVVVLALVLYALPAPGRQASSVALATDNARLEQLPSNAFQVAVRFGVRAPGDTPPLTFIASRMACPRNEGQGDMGSQVRSADGGCWLAENPPSGVDVRQFGAKVDGTTDDAAAIQAAIDAMAAAGGGRVLLGRGVSAISAGLTARDNVTLVGCGGGGPQVGREPTLRSACTRLLWIGRPAGSETMLTFAPPPRGQRGVGGGAQDLLLDCNGAASNGLDLKSWIYAEFRNIVVRECRSVGYLLSEVDYILAGPPYDVQDNTFFNYQYDPGPNPANISRGMWLVGSMSPDHQGNASENQFYNGTLETNSPGVALELDDTDDNVFINTTASFRGGQVTGHPTFVLGSGDDDTSGRGEPARFNHFDFLLALTGRADAGQRGGKSSFGNTIVAYSRANGVPPFAFQAPAGGSPSATAFGFDDRGNPLGGPSMAPGPAK